MLNYLLFLPLPNSNVNYTTSYYLIFFKIKAVILANHSPITHLTMHLAREGGAGYNKAMKNFYRVMLGAGIYES
jgi:hypothetical protein